MRRRGPRGAALAPGGLGAAGGPPRAGLRRTPSGPADRARRRRGAQAALPGGAGLVLTVPARLGNLPRDTRDTLFLLAVIGWVALPHVAHLPWWVSLLVASILAWRGTIAVQGTPLPGRGWVVVLLAGALLATWATHRTLLGRDAGVTLIVCLLALKTLELRARRDAFVVFFLGFFTMLTNFFFSQSLAVAGAMLAGLLGLL